MRKLIVLAALALVVSAPAAQALEAGDGLYGIQITNGIADLYDPTGLPDGVSAYDHSEIGVGLQYWRMMSSDYAFTMSGGIGFFSEKQEPGTLAAPTTGDFEYTQSSWNVRVGGDRVVQVGDRGTFYFGPGLEYWTGTAKFDGQFFTPALETEAVSRFAISGRVGGIMWLTDKAGFNCQVGRYVGYASVEDEGAKTTWYPSGFQASGGLVLKF